MKYIDKVLPQLLLLAGMVTSANAQMYTSGSRLVHVQEARTPKEGTLTFYNNMSAFGQAATSGTAWDVRNAINLDYSFTDYLMIAVNATLYQDLNDGSGEANSPIHDFNLTLKTGSFGFSADYFQLGGMVNAYFPVGESPKHNTAFEVYRGLGVGLHLQGFLSYYGDNLFPDESYSIHSNLGFSTYFDKGKEALDTKAGGINIPGTKTPLPSPKTTKAVSELKYAFGAKYPFSMLDLYGEVWGNVFLVEPDKFIQARETYSYLTLGLGARPIDLLKLDVSLDVLAAGGKNKSFLNTSELGGGIKDVNYAPWKLNIGLKINILPFKTTYAIDPSRRYEISEREASEIRSRVRIIEEDEAVTKDKVETLKAKRKDVESNLKQLRDLLKQLDTNQDNN